MKTISILSVAILGVMQFFTTNTESPGYNNAVAKTWKVNTEESSFKWIGTKVTGQHDGTIKYKSGELVTDKNKLVAGNFEIDMNSIENVDVANEGSRTKLVNHLKSEDFFDIKNYPVSKFVITKAEIIPNVKAGENNYNITGDMTIRGLAKSITFPAFVVISKKQIVANAEFKIDRTNHDIKYRSGKFAEGIGDKMIHDEFTVKIRVVGATK